MLKEREKWLQRERLEEELAKARESKQDTIQAQTVAKQARVDAKRARVEAKMAQDNALAFS